MPFIWQLFPLILFVLAFEEYTWRFLLLSDRGDTSKMLRLLFSIAIISFSCLCLANEERSSVSFRMGEERLETVNADPYIRVCELKDNQEDPSDLSKRSDCLPFLELKQDLVSEKAYAFILTLDNESNRDQELIFFSKNPLITRARLYQRIDARLFQDISQNRISTTRPSFRITLPAAKTTELILTTQYSFMSKTSFILQNTPSFQARDRLTISIQQLCYGLFLGLIIYNFFLFFALKVRAYLSHAQYIGILTLFLFFLDGNCYHWFQIDLAPGFLASQLNFANFFAILFFRDLFRTRKKLIESDQVLRIASYTSLILGAISLTNQSTTLINKVSLIHTLLCTLACLFIAFYLNKKSSFQIWPYFFSWIALGFSLFFWSNNLSQYSALGILSISTLGLGFGIQSILLSYELSADVSRFQKKLISSLKENHLLLEEKIAARTKDALEKSESLSREIEKNNDAVIELRHQAASRIATVSDLAHQSNNPLHVSYLSLEFLKKRLQKHKQSIFKIFPEPSQQEPEEKEFLDEFEHETQSWENELHKLDMNLDRIRQAILEIRVMSGVDGFHLRYTLVEELIPHIINKLEEAAAGVLPFRLTLINQLQNQTKIFSNPLALMVIIERMFRQLMIQCQSDLTVSLRNSVPKDPKAGIIFDFTFSREKLSKPIDHKNLLDTLSYSLKPFGVSLEYDSNLFLVTLLPLSSEPGP